MNRTIRVCGYCLLVLALALPAAGAEGESAPFDVYVGFNGISPGQDDDWDDAAGLEVQARFWRNQHLGIALAVGSEMWEAVGTVSEFDDGRISEYTALSGDASLTSVGLSLLYHSSGAFVEIGMRYLSVDSSVFVEASYDGPDGSDYRYEAIDIADTLIFTARVGFEVELADRIMLIPSIGYQVDLRKPEEKFAGQSLGETDFRGVTFGIGLACEL